MIPSNEFFRMSYMRKKKVKSRTYVPPLPSEDEIRKQVLCDFKKFYQQASVVGRQEEIIDKMKRQTLFDFKETDYRFVRGITNQLDVA